MANTIYSAKAVEKLVKLHENFKNLSKLEERTWQFKQKSQGLPTRRKSVEKGLGFAMLDEETTMEIKMQGGRENLNMCRAVEFSIVLTWLDKPKISTLPPGCKWQYWSRAESSFAPLIECTVFMVWLSVIFRKEND